jgi:hypothetical protein
MFDKLIADVPTRIWEEGRPAEQRIWDTEFNVASWIKVSGYQGEVSLLMRYEDESGENHRVVDHCKVTSGDRALLSGPVGVRFTGKVKKVQMLLRLADPAIRFHVDELFVQRKGQDLQRENKLISNS